jgi:predicted N-acyltransferase
LSITKRRVVTDKQRSAASSARTRWRALERSGSIGGASGWEPFHLVCRDEEDGVLGALCLYLKTDG